MSNLLFIIFLAAIAVYVLYAAISGKGRLYSADFIKDEYKDTFKKTLRKIYLTLGIVMLLETLVMVGQGYLFKADNYHFTATYYDANGRMTEVKEENDEYYQLENGQWIPAKTYSEEEFIEKFCTKSGENYVLSTYSTNPLPAYNSDDPNGYFFTESYYEASGLKHTIALSNGEYTESIGTAAAIPVTKYTQADFEATFMSTDETKPLLNVTKDDPLAADTTTTNTSSSSLLSCMGTSSGSSTPAVAEAAKYGYSPAHKSETIFSGISYEAFNIMNYVFMGLSLAILVGLFIVIRKMTDKDKKAKARSTNGPAGGMPSAAFNFDDDDTSK